MRRKHKNRQRKQLNGKQKGKPKEMLVPDRGKSCRRPRAASELWKAARNHRWGYTNWTTAGGKKAEKEDEIVGRYILKDLKLRTGTSYPRWTRIQILGSKLAWLTRSLLYSDEFLSASCRHNILWKQHHSKTHSYAVRSDAVIGIEM